MGAYVRGGGSKKGRSGAGLGVHRAFENSSGVNKGVSK